jgi:hypothetical protein
MKNMSRVLLVLFCTGILGTQLLPADHHTKGEEFIATVTNSLQKLKTTKEKLASFHKFIQPHYDDFWNLIQRTRRQEDENDLTLEEFFSYIFPTPLSDDWTKPAMQLWLLYTTHLLIQDPETINAILTQDTRYAIRDYITHHDLSEWIFDTINPLAPNIVHYFMLPLSKV